jgi:hypothetical protein
MIIDFIERMFAHSFKKEWYETYWAIDLHGTIIKSTYKGTEVEYYPYAKPTLQLLSQRKDIKMILWTSSFPGEILEYLKRLEEDGIVFDHVNENPGISSKNGNFGYYSDKFYFNVLIDDKAGFDPNIEWFFIYSKMKLWEEQQWLPNPNWTTKF